MFGKRSIRILEESVYFAFFPCGYISSCRADRNSGHCAHTGVTGIGKALTAFCAALRRLVCRVCCLCRILCRLCRNGVCCAVRSVRSNLRGVFRGIAVVNQVQIRCAVIVIVNGVIDGIPVGIQERIRNPVTVHIHAFRSGFRLRYIGRSRSRICIAFQDAEKRVRARSDQCAFHHTDAGVNQVTERNTSNCVRSGSHQAASRSANGNSGKSASSTANRGTNCSTDRSREKSANRSTEQFARDEHGRGGKCLAEEFARNALQEIRKKLGSRAVTDSVMDRAGEHIKPGSGFAAKSAKYKRNQRVTENLTFDISCEETNGIAKQSSCFRADLVIRKKKLAE